MKQIGEEVQIHYELRYGPPPRPGDVLKTARGRCYLVIAIRKGKRRYHASCLVADPAKLTGQEMLYTMAWDRRERSRKRPALRPAPSWP